MLHGTEKLQLSSYMSPTLFIFTYETYTHKVTHSVSSHWMINFSMAELLFLVVSPVLGMVLGT